MTSEFKPKIIAFLCNWCSYAGADKAGGQRLECSAEISIVRVMCSGRVDPQFILEAFRKGADGVLVLGCHPGDCHYRNGNIRAMRRMAVLEKLLVQFGIEKERFALDWVAAGESEKFQKISQSMTEAVTRLGPLKLKGYVTR
ncbi:MAG: hydrogenase iron-sulfur subunit [Spirochaetales bacterium]|nr:hydrogenase iron-sulfur subunit [Spirochaetales bacterium]